MWSYGHKQIGFPIGSHIKLMSEANGFYGNFVAIKLNFYSFYNPRI
jgi:hypothetical protein